MHEEPVGYLGDEIRMAGEFVEAWLGRKDWTPDRWVDDFTGLNLPPLPANEPYVWWLLGLGTGLRRVLREEKLAGRLAQVLDLAPDRHQLDHDRKQALYNALVLCSEIRKPESLAEPLKRMLLRASLPDISAGYNLRFVLRQALMMNPPGRELEPVWVAMAKGESHTFLPSDRYDALNGVLLLPEDERGEFAAGAMSEVLKALADALEGDEHNAAERGRRFGGMLDRIAMCWLSERYLAHFWRQSWDRAWPPWAIVCIAKALGLRGRALDEIHFFCLELEEGERTANGVNRRERGGLFNTATVFTRKSRDISDGMSEALNAELERWRHEFEVPAA